MIHDLLSLAHKYQFPDLQKSISDCLIKSLTADNVCDVFDVACLYYLEDLRTNCLTYLDQYAVEVMKSDSFCDLSHTSLVELLQRRSFFAPEIEIFRGASRWVHHNRDRVDASVIDCIMECVCLSHIELADLLSEVRASGLVTSETLLDSVAKQQLCELGEGHYRGRLSKYIITEWIS